MTEKLANLKKLAVEWTEAMLVVVLLTAVCNVIGYGGNMIESIPGILILCVISYLGLIVKELLPFKGMPAVTYIGIIGMILAVPVSPVAEPIIYWTNKIDLMASITPLLAYAGVMLGKDWKAFLQIGWKGILVSLLTIFGTFFVSGWIAEVLTGVF